MNICIVTPRYPYKEDMSFVFVKKLVDEWALQGHNCIVVSFFSLFSFWQKHLDYRPRYYIDEVAPGIYVKVFNPRAVSFGHLCIKGISVSEWVFSLVFNRLMKRIKTPFDFFYNHFFSSALCSYAYAHKNNIPFFIATGESSVVAPKKPFQRFSLKDFRTFTKGIIAVSGMNKKEAVRLGMIEENKCQVFPNGTDLSVFFPRNKNECRDLLGLPKDAFIVICVGFFCERKGQNRLLKAVQKLNDNRVKLLFIGTSPKIDPLLLEGEEILFKGAVDNKELPIYLNASDVFCLPTLAEGCCNAIIEALACGLPIVSSNLPFNWDVLDGSNSLLVNPNDIDSISSALNELSHNSELSTKLSEGSLARATKLSINSRSCAIMDFIKEKM